MFVKAYKLSGDLRYIIMTIVNNYVYLKFAEVRSQVFSPCAKESICEVMDMLIGLIVVIISQ